MTSKNELNNETINNILNGTNNNNNVVKTETNEQKLSKYGFSSEDTKKAFKQFGKQTDKIVCNADNILMNREIMAEVLEKKKQNKKPGLDIEGNIILRPIPVGYNENMPEKIVDMDPFAINRNLRVKGKYYTIRDEITYYELDQIVNKLKSKYEFFTFEKQHYKIKDIKYQPVKLNTYVSQTLKYLLLNFLIDFNINVKKSGIGSKYHEFTPFQIINVNLTKILHNNQLNIYRYVLTIELYRKNKRNSLNFYMEILYKSDKDIILYDKLYNIGMRNDEHIAFNKLANRENNNYLSINKLTEDNLNKDKIIKTDAETNKILQNREEQYDLDHHLKQFKCYNPRSVIGIDEQAITKNDCLSYSQRYKCPGKWDIACKTDHECPFYQANKNYPNTRGGCIEGKCEMPVNVGNVGHHFMDKKQPICYNCKKIGNNKNCKGEECNMCCEEQKNRHLYPELATPDFAYYNDYTKRVIYNDQLKQRNLKPYELL